MISSIQLSEETKKKLHMLKENKTESYESVINRLLEKEEKENFEELMKQGYIETAEENLKLCKEMEVLDKDPSLDWEWKE